MNEMKKGASGPDEVVHAYDDIEEYDNALPNWWLVTFYGAIIFSAVYWFGFHSFDKGVHPRAEFEKEMAELKKTQAAQPVKMASAEEILALSKDPAQVSKGAEVFKTICAPCHKEDGSGLVGPNLTDKMWINGGKPDEIYKTIAEGAGGGTMPAQRVALGEEKVRAAAAYVLTLKGKNLPGKPPESNAKPE